MDSLEARVRDDVCKGKITVCKSQTSKHTNKKLYIYAFI